VIPFDTTARPTKPSEWQGLVEAIFKAAPEDESDWLEWKATIDWSDKAHLGGLVARAILSFANRMEPPPPPQLAGSGLLILGMEPALARGIDKIDPATLEEKLRPYLGEAGPAFEVRWHAIDGKDVMSIEVPNPGPGSPIYALHKEVGKYQNGTIFVRGRGKTGQATAAQITALTRRAVAVESDQIDVSLGPMPKFTLPRVLVSARSTAIYVKWLRDRLLQPMHDRQLKNSLLGPINLERRSTADFIAEVDDYIARVRAEVDEAVLDFAAGLVPPVILRISNRTGRNYPGMRITLTLAGAILARESDDVIERIDAYLPTPPEKWGTSAIAAIARSSFNPSPAVPRGISRTTIEHGEKLVVRLGEFDLRAFEEDVTIIRDLILLVPDGHKGPVHVGWTATCADINGMAEGEFWIPGSEPSIDPIRRAMEMGAS
jgi:hypothetical protein